MTSPTGRWEPSPYFMYGHHICTEYPRIPLIQHAVLDMDFSIELRVMRRIVRGYTKNIQRRAKYNRKFRREIYRLALLRFERRMYGGL